MWWCPISTEVAVGVKCIHPLDEDVVVAHEAAGVPPVPVVPECADAFQLALGFEAFRGWRFLAAFHSVECISRRLAVVKRGEWGARKCTFELLGVLGDAFGADVAQLGRVGIPVAVVNVTDAAVPVDDRSLCYPWLLVING